jgi:hypothetical protein
MMGRPKASAKTEIAPANESIEKLLGVYLQEKPRDKYGNEWSVELRDTKTGPRMLAIDRQAQAMLVKEIVDRLVAGRGSMVTGWGHRRSLFLIALKGLLRRKLPLEEAVLTRLLNWIAEQRERYEVSAVPLLGVSEAVGNLAALGSLGEPLRAAIIRTVDRLRMFPSEPTCRRVAEELQSVVGEGEPVVRIEPGEAWSDAALADVAEMDPSRRRAWTALLASCQAAGSGALSARWSRDVLPLIEAVGRDDFRKCLLRWFPLVDRPPAVRIPRESIWEPDWDNLIRQPNVDLLKGLAWCAGFEADRDLARALGALASSAYRKIPEKGCRLPAIGNAAVAALGTMPGRDAIGQLALLKGKVKSIPEQRQIEKALAAASGRLDISADDVDELAVPAYGMHEVGRRREVLAECAAELVVDGPKAVLRFSNVSTGEAVRSIPASIKKDKPAEVKELQAVVKDVGKMLTAQRARIDGLFLARKRWPIDSWRLRYLDHPLVGTISRRLIWIFETGGTASPGIWLDGRIVGADSRPLEGFGPETMVELWHPINQPADHVTAWRDWLERHQIRQPFKQAHREVYVLTDAERATRIYSNRFAAHVLRQHQYHALCASRGWRNKLRLTMSHGDPPTSKDLLEWGLRAEFWVDGIGGYDGRDSTISGAFLYLSTDQVRFYEIGGEKGRGRAGSKRPTRGPRQPDAEPISLDRVPPLVLSEIFRDVDLLVGVASVGNDPTWFNGRPQRRDVDYWNRFSFGDLTASGQTRKTVLERLIPRLQIAPRCTFSDRFLVVRGDLGTYKIHLGSGNILMAPDNQYLCIVPKPGASDPKSASAVFLPFEGDDTLSIILSKALLLANDSKISDPTIVRQIKR